MSIREYEEGFLRKLGELGALHYMRQNDIIRVIDDARWQRKLLEREVVHRIPEEAGCR